MCCVRLFRQCGAVAEHADSHPADYMGLHLPLAATRPLSAARAEVCAGHWHHAVWAAHLQLLPVAARAPAQAPRGEIILRLGAPWKYWRHLY